MPDLVVRYFLSLALLTVASVGSVFAAAPTLDALHPTGGRPGESVTVAIVGKSDPWPVSAWCSHPGIKITTDKEKKAELIFAIPADAKPGPVLVRLFNAEGASELHTFIVGSKTLPEHSEVEPNSSLQEPKSLAPDSEKSPPLPLVVNGKLSESSDVDLFPLALKKGQKLKAKLDGYALISPIDPHLVLYGPPPRREVVAIANDGPNSLDPLLHHQVERDGEYLIGVMGFIHPPSSKISFHSSSSAVYRLTLSTGPWLTFPEPSIVPGRKPTKLKLHGGKAPIDLSLPAADAKTEPGYDAAAPNPVRYLSHPAFPNTFAIPSSDIPLQSGEKITLPAAVSGTLSKPGETDAAKFTSSKGDKIQFKLLAHYLSSNLDPVLIIENSEGKELKRADDTKPTVDAWLLWTAPADGDYVVRIADVIGSGSENHRYLLTAEISEPDFSATVSASKFSLKPGDKTELTIKLTRVNGHKASLEAKVENLPSGVKAEIAKLPEKSGDFKITLKADASAKPANQTLRIVVEEKSDGDSRSKPAHFTFVGEDWRAPYLVETTRDIWLTVAAKPEEKKKKEEPKKTDKK